MTKTIQSFTLDGTDVELTKFVEYMAEYWLDLFATSMNISEVRYDMGHQVLTFVTECGKEDISSHILSISKTFPTIFIMYMHKKYDSIDGQAMCHYIMGGKINISEHVNVLEVLDE